MRKAFPLLLVLIFLFSAVGPAIDAQGDNHPPVADGGPDKYAGVGATVYFDGSDSSDPDGDTLTYSWDFDDNDGIQEDAAGAIVSYIYYAVGEYRVTLTVSDSNLTDNDVVLVYISEDHRNRAPTAVISEPSDFSFFNTSAPVTFDGSGSSDPDGDLLSYDWDFGDGSEASGKVVEYMYSDPGVYTVALTVSDGEFDSVAEVTIIIEGAPSIPGIPGPPGIGLPGRPSISTGGPYEVYAKYPLIINPYYETSGGNFSVCWDVDASNGIQYRNCQDGDDSNNYPDVSTAKFPVIVYDEPGTYTLTAIIMDSVGDMIGTTLFYLYGINTTTVTVIPHDSMEVDAGRDKEIVSGQKTTLNGQIALTSWFKSIEWIMGCGWDFESDGIEDFSISFNEKDRLKKASCGASHTYIVNGTSKNDTIFTTTLAGYSEGAFTVYYGDDYPETYEYNHTQSDTVNLTVPAPPNKVPVVTCGPDKIGDNSVYVGESTSFIVEAYDPDDDELRLYEWDFNSDGQVDYSNPASGDTNYAYKSSGRFQAKASVTDERDGVGVCFINVTVLSNEPPIAIISADESADAGEEVEFDGSESYDPNGDGEIASYSWDFDADNGITTDAVGETVNHVFDKAGTYTVTLTVKDRHGAEASETHDIEITQTYKVGLDLSGTASVEVEPGKSHTFSLKVTNSGNGHDCFDLTKSGTKSTWGEFGATEVCLAAGEARDVTLRVTVPRTATAEDQAIITVEVASQGSSSVTDSVRLTVKAEQSYGVSVYMSQLRAEIKQGASTTTAIRITNLGNGEDSFKLTADGTDKAWVKFKSSTLTLEAGESKEITVTITVPSGAKTGAHDISLGAVSSSDGSVKDTVTFGVDVKAGEGGGTEGLPGFEASAVVLSIAVAVIVIALVGRRRRL